MILLFDDKILKLTVNRVCPNVAQFRGRVYTLRLTWISYVSV